MAEVTKEPRRIHVSHGPQEQRIGLEADFPRCLGSEGGRAPPAWAAWILDTRECVRHPQPVSCFFFFFFFSLLVFSLFVSSFQIRFKILPVCLARSEDRGVPPHSQQLCLSRLPACSLGCFGGHPPSIRFADEVLGEVSRANARCCPNGWRSPLLPLLPASSAGYLASLVQTRREGFFPNPLKRRRPSNSPAS